jgi:hypothetical protein
MTQHAADVIGMTVALVLAVWACLDWIVRR